VGGCVCFFWIWNFVWSISCVVLGVELGREFVVVDDVVVVLQM
jgi:hypothetical protein